MQWPPRPGPGLERREAERLRRGGVDHLPHVDLHPVAELRELVDERDVDGAVDVLEQLRQLGGLGRRDLVHRVDRRAVDVGGGLRARGVDPADDLRRRLRRPVLAARVDALGRHREMEVLAGLQAASRARGSAAGPRASCPATSSTRARRPGRAGAPARGCARRARCRRGRARAGGRAASAARSAPRAPACTCS